jgi:hypothetical protein
LLFQPCTKREFLNYLKYVEHAPENLQFFLWFKDYEKRFNSIAQNEKDLAPEWTEALVESERKEYRNQIKKTKTGVSQTASELFKNSDFDERPKPEDSSDPLPFENVSRGALSEDNLSVGRPMSGITTHTAAKSFMSHVSRAESAFDQAGLNQPFTMQPFREEINRIMGIYIVQGAPRQLNISGRELRAVVKAAHYTTHPSAFREIVNTVEYTLRRQAHPNFIRWAICNGNRPRVIFARGLGVFCIAAALIADIIITISSLRRGWRVLPIIILFLGCATLFAAWKGMCVVLHGLHHQHVRPWELFIEDDSITEKASSEYTPKTSLSVESMGSGGSNSFEDEPWVAKYKHRNVIRQVFDREIWIQEPALRQIQDTIFVQALLLSLLVSAIIVAIFVAVPAGHLM